jgi:hypothetical protein
VTRRELESTVRKLLGDQLFGVLATSGSGGPHTTIVAYAAADDLHALVFATPRGTRKFENLKKAGWVSIFVDNRTNNGDDRFEIYGIEARGPASELLGDERRSYESLYRARHPMLSGFAEGSAMIKIEVRRYDVVHRFQEVLVLDFDDQSEGSE